MDNHLDIRRSGRLVAPFYDRKEKNTTLWIVTHYQSTPCASSHFQALSSAREPTEAQSASSVSAKLHPDDTIHHPSHRSVDPLYQDHLSSARPGVFVIHLVVRWNTLDTNTSSPGVFVVQRSTRYTRSVHNTAPPLLVQWPPHSALVWVRRDPRPSLRLSRTHVGCLGQGWSHGYPSTAHLLGQFSATVWRLLHWGLWNLSPRPTRSDRPPSPWARADLNSSSPSSPPLPVSVASLQR